jgi:hypothetical protein
MTTKALALPLTELGGMPFLDDGFVSRRLLAAVAAVRHVEAEQRGMTTTITDATVEAWLAPSRAYMLRRAEQIPASPLAHQLRLRVTEVLERLAVLLPTWEPLLRLPIRFALLETGDGSISASSRAWPQHILLAQEAFAGDQELREQVVHELSHQWLYLIQEVWALQNDPAPRLTLPSGTGDRTPAEVLGAGHVAATLLRLYRADGSAPDRVGYLSDYGLGCLHTLDAADQDLTDAGRQIARRVKEAL